MRYVYGAVLYVLALIPAIFITSVLFIFDDYAYATVRRLFLGVVVSYASTVVLLVRDTRTNELLPDEKRSLWSVLIVVGSSAAQLAYLWWYVVPGASSASRRRRP